MATGVVVVDDCDNVATSFPGFVALATSIGFSLSARAAG
jgi:3-phosphoshikimate 1-carboxyvinyltransferase